MSPAPGAAPMSPEPGEEPMRRPLAAFRRLYGASPLHLLALIASLVVTAAAVVRWFDSAPSDTLRILVWFGGAIVAHDVVLLPLYSALDLIAFGRRDTRARVTRASTPREHAHGWVYVRVPALLSGLIFLVFAAEILRLGGGTFKVASGSGQGVYLSRFLFTCGAVFAASGLAYAVSLARGRRRGRLKGV